MRRVLLVLLAVLLAGAPASAAGRPEVKAQAETPGLFDDEEGGNADADDPAIWVNDREPGRSIVVATAKEGGLYSYRLDGTQIKHVPAPARPGPEHAPGRFNNVDIVGDIAIVSDRGRDQIRFYQVNGLVDVTAPDVPFVFNTTQSEVDEQQTAYGLTAWYDKRDRATYVLVSRRSTTRVALLRVEPRGAKFSYKVVRTLDLPAEFTLPNGVKWQPCDEPGQQPQVEGMVVDYRTGTLYAGQEDVGIWRMSARLDDKPVLIDKVREFGIPGTYDPSTEECTPGKDPGFGGKHVSADVEGLTIHYGRNLLLASSQGDNSFAAYDLPGRYRTSFQVKYKDDLVQESDGAAVIGTGLGHRFPNGLLVVQDGDNTGEPRDSTNFKFVGWDDVAHAIR
ncbi:3-phytase [Kibdelosporangium banguiense]|uniref:3-phytase n=1 Tax=Kibdelosporangium banguiense TaxID=1365924 RepID=A0ABS4TDU0_9PSEU|nr:phytase [Kibdelosporangium banguiense]MBP2322587.1 3-phytase [Kibdelosporangium banguiense]